jgi:hypothetical protein
LLIHSVASIRQRLLPPMMERCGIPRNGCLYSPECVEEEFCELRHNGVLRSSQSELQETFS